MFFAQANAATNVNTVKAAIVKHSIEMGVDPAITLSIAKTESGYRHEARSCRGAVGVFQLMPSTARRMGLNPYKLDDNIKAGIMYYKSMYKMFGSMELALAAYNAGPVAVKRYKAIPPFAETKRYVARVMSDYRHLRVNPDPAIVASTNASKHQEQTQNHALPQSLQKILAKSADKLEDNNATSVKELQPKEVGLKSQSVAI